MVQPADDPFADRTRTEEQREGPSASEPLRAPEPMDREIGPRPGGPDKTKRAIAMIIDAVAAVLVGMIPVIGGLVATAYWLVRDGLDVEFMPFRSLGKQLTGLKPVRVDGKPMDIETSIRRNWPFAVGGIAQVLLFIPIIGWLLVIPVILVALGLGLTEAFLVLTDDEGRRLGDRTGETRVIEVGGGVF